eukprot:GILK01000260.1.p1 GENE.GILK01000260.1~~GILK01000260.1.p1  ORF type:complete len:151 (+),score=19.83 GILK01000260.1:74-526(+)
MSWQDFVSTQLIANGACAEGAILSAADGSVWATSNPTFAPQTYAHPQEQDDGSVVSLNVNEGQELAGLFNNNGKPVGKAGLRFNGNKYYVVQYFPDTQTVYAKTNKGGACFSKTNQTIVVGTWSEDRKQTGGACNGNVERLAEYLRNSSY